MNTLGFRNRTPFCEVEEQYDDAEEDGASDPSTVRFFFFLSFLGLVVVEEVEVDSTALVVGSEGGGMEVIWVESTAEVVGGSGFWVGQWRDGGGSSMGGERERESIYLSTIQRYTQSCDETGKQG